ncbi:hypothetical protein BM221_008997 [Beauveria bassiana]|uniref:Uncharacterized protein n=1 Tax=Beauveria bassiana TaxID=176275 RepID=A0A2N6NEH6_BEABA|nr:hypothetical protein BM221_008997 [Beauveria bassiana]
MASREAAAHLVGIRGKLAALLLRDEDIVWLGSNLRGWLKTIYIIDDTETSSPVPRNKDREAMVYLAIVDLKALFIFLPSGSDLIPDSAM